MTGEIIKDLRKRAKMSQSELAKRSGYNDRSSIAKIESGKVDLPESKIKILADIFDITPAALMGLEPISGAAQASNVQPGLNTYKVPRLGLIACGEPILADENIGDYDDVPDYIKCDFTLVCRGDSMINARIYDGDIVCIKANVEIKTGDIAAVLVDGDEATLKRVRIFEDHIILEPENPNYRPLSFWEEEMNRVKLIGKATHFISVVR